MKRTALLACSLTLLFGESINAASPSIKRIEIDGGSLTLSPSAADLLAFKGALIGLRGAQGRVDRVQPVGFKAIEGIYREVMTEKLNTFGLFGKVVSAPFDDFTGRPSLYIAPTFRFTLDTVRVRLEIFDERTFMGRFEGSGAGLDSYTVSEGKAYWECREDLEKDFQRFVELLAIAAGIEPPGK